MVGRVLSVAGRPGHDPLRLAAGAARLRHPRRRTWPACCWRSPCSRSSSRTSSPSTRSSPSSAPAACSSASAPGSARACSTRTLAGVFAGLRHGLQGQRRWCCCPCCWSPSSGRAAAGSRATAVARRRHHVRRRPAGRVRRLPRRRAVRFVGPAIWDVRLNPQWVADKAYFVQVSSGTIDVPFMIQWAGTPRLRVRAPGHRPVGHGPGLGLAGLVGPGRRLLALHARATPASARRCCVLAWVAAQPRLLRRPVRQVPALPACRSTSVWSILAAYLLRAAPSTGARARGALRYAVAVRRHRWSSPRPRSGRSPSATHLRPAPLAHPGVGVDGRAHPGRRDPGRRALGRSPAAAAAEPARPGTYRYRSSSCTTPRRRRSADQARSRSTRATTSSSPAAA